MIVEKYGTMPHQNDYYGKRVVCRNCGSRLIIQDDDRITYDGKEYRHCLYLGDRIKFECPFCCDERKDKASGVIYRNRFCAFLDKHDKICAVIEWFKDYGVAMFICILVLAGLIFGIMYRTNSYTMGDDYIEFYIKDNQEKHMIVDHLKGDYVTIVDHLKEDK